MLRYPRATRWAGPPTASPRPDRPCAASRRGGATGCSPASHRRRGKMDAERNMGSGGGARASRRRRRRGRPTRAQHTPCRHTGLAHGTGTRVPAVGRGRAAHRVQPSGRHNGRRSHPRGELPAPPSVGVRPPPSRRCPTRTARSGVDFRECTGGSAAGHSHHGRPRPARRSARGSIVEADPQQPGLSRARVWLLRVGLAARPTTGRP